jgi:hypothetical protein
MKKCACSLSRWKVSVLLKKSSLYVSAIFLSDWHHSASQMACAEQSISISAPDAHPHKFLKMNRNLVSRYRFSIYSVPLVFYWPLITPFWNLFRIFVRRSFCPHNGLDAFDGILVVYKYLCSRIHKTVGKNAGILRHS